MSFTSMLLQIGVKSHDNAETKAQKNIFMFLLLLGSLASFFIPLVFTSYLQSQNALGDIADDLTLLLVVWSVQWISTLLVFIDFSRKKEIGFRFHIVMLILLFYLSFQTYLYGGLFKGGLILIWGLLAPIATLFLLDKHKISYFFVYLTAYVLLI